MIRVCKKGGYVVFDAHTEDALTEEALSNERNTLNQWRIIPKQIVEKIFEKNEMKLIRRFENLMIAGAGAENKLMDSIVENWYIYKKEDA